MTQSNSWQGWLFAAIAVLGFGTNFLPVKKFETGDGFFFQWILSMTIWIFGFFTYIYRGFPTFQPLAMFGGFLWSMGNIMVVPIVKTIGLGMGLLVWGLTNLMAGWCSGTFGLFGLKKQEVSRPTLNYIGFGLAIVSLFFYGFVKPESQTRVSAEEEEDGEYEEGMKKSHGYEEENSLNFDLERKVNREGSSWVDKLSPLQQRVIGFSLAVLSGVFYGVNFDPPQYLIDHSTIDPPPEGLDFVFAHFTGIFLTGTLFFLLYCIFKKNKPNVYPQVILPAVASGALWAIADISWFIANSSLEFVISFPIIATGPGVIASLFGIFMFKEIRGLKNFIFFGIAFGITLCAQLLIAFSR